MLKLKDIFTLLTIVLGFLVLPFLLKNQILIASFLVILGALTDLLDGIIARKRGTQNRFGKEFDLIADLVIYSMSPALILFFAYKDLGLFWSAVIGLIPLMAGCIRVARFNVKEIEYPGYFLGLPRPISALIIISLVNSNLFANYYFKIIGILIVLLLGILNLTFIPYPGHHKRKLNIGGKLIIVLIGIILVTSIYFRVFWDLLLVFLLIYLTSPMYIVPKEERKKIEEYVRNWKKKLNK